MKRILLSCLAALSLQAAAQGTVEDYKRAYSMQNRFRSSLILGQADGVRWTSPTTFTYTTRTAEGEQHMQGTVGADGVLQLAPAEGTQQNTGRQQNNRRNDRPQWRDSRVNTATKQGPQLVQNHWMNVDDERYGQPMLSPDSTLRAYIKNDNIYVSRADGSQERQLTFDGTLGLYYSAYLQWSPDGKYICTNRIRPVSEKRYVYYVESSPTTQLQPILHQQEYAKPGDELQQRRPCVVEVATGRNIVPQNDLFPNPYDLHSLSWCEDSHAIRFEYNERGHQVYRLLEMSVETGQVRTLIEERSHTFVNYNRLWHQPICGGKKMIWQSERDNWAHLYLYDFEENVKDKKGKNKGLQTPKVTQITRGEWVVRQVLKVDEDKQLIYFTASGVNKDEDPYLIHYYRIGFDGKGFTCLTPGNGNHSARFNDDYTYLVDTYSRVDQAPVTVLRSVENPDEGQQVACADISQLETSGFVMPEVFAAPGRDGKTMMWGIIHRPTNLDPTKKYPVIEYIYAGPGDAYTPKSFRVFDWNMTALAELGFIVVQLDAMGTSYRGKKFEEVCYKNLQDAGFPDRIAWIKAAAERYPYMDTEHVGIFGASAGGQESTTAVLLHGDFYKAAYSSCGCHDNRMDKIWWNEQWMGWPVDSSYVESSNVTNAHKLQGALMLVVGEMDDNVDPASTMQVADALIKANKDFELVVLPGVHHTMGESFGEHKRYDFFVKNLLGVTPPKWNEVSR